MAGQGSTVTFASRDGGRVRGVGRKCDDIKCGSPFTATQAGSANYLAAVAVGSLNDVPLGSGTVSLSASASSGLGVSFVSTTQSVCTVSATTATMLSGGPCAITASQSGGGNYAAASSITRIFNVTVVFLM